MCPGATRFGRVEECDVFKDGLAGVGSDGQHGRVIEGKWYCCLHGDRMRKRAPSKVVR
jgi:hypothetical protein